MFSVKKNLRENVMYLYKLLKDANDLVRSKFEYQNLDPHIYESSLARWTEIKEIITDLLL